MNQQHILVTGGAGFIGSHLVEKLLAEGAHVTVLDNFLTGRKANLSSVLDHPRLCLLEQDVCDLTDLSDSRFTQSMGLSGIFHLACPASPVDFDTIPFEIMRVDSIGTMKTIELAVKHGARYLVASTSEIYGDPLVHPQKEVYWGNVNSIGPRACYDEAKRFSEAAVSTAIRGVGKLNGRSYRPLDGRIVRIFNTYGPRMRPDDGRIVPELCVQALKGEPLTIHGDGNQTRSFCFVSDLVEGIYRLYRSEHRSPTNIGNPVEYRVIEFATILRELVIRSGSPDPGVRHLPGRPDDPKRRCPDIGVAKSVLGWEPKVALKDGLARSLEAFAADIGIGVTETVGVQGEKKNINRSVFL